MQHRVHIIFDDPDDAAQAVRRLDAEGIEPPVEQFIVRKPLRSQNYGVAFSHARAGAAVGALVTSIFGAILLSLAVAGDALFMSMPLAALAGFLGGGLYGAVLGAIAGATEPNESLRRVRRTMQDGQAAVVARFRTTADGRRAEQVLRDSPGAATSV